MQSNSPPIAPICVHPRPSAFLLLHLDHPQSLLPSLTYLHSLIHLHCTLLTPHAHPDLPPNIHLWHHLLPPSLTELSTELIDQIRDRAFDAAIIFTAPHQSPYVLAYLCYLAGIPLRYGQSREFGGAVLSKCIVPPLDPVSLTDYHLHLLQSIDFSVQGSVALVAS